MQCFQISYKSFKYLQRAALTSEKLLALAATPEIFYNYIMFADYNYFFSLENYNYFFSLVFLSKGSANPLSTRARQQRKVAAVERKQSFVNPEIHKNLQNVRTAANVEFGAVQYESLWCILTNAAKQVFAS